MQTSGSGETSPASRLSSGDEVDVSNCFIVKMSRDVVSRLLLTYSVKNLVSTLIIEIEIVSTLTSTLWHVSK